MSTNHVDVFRAMCKAHDLTFEYSDDGEVWRRGNASLDGIKRYAAEHLDRETAVRIWNEQVDLTLAPNCRDSFYWR